MTKIRILLVDDNALLRAALRTYLEAQRDLEVVGEASSGGEALQVVGPLAPDIVLLDVRLPDLDGPWVARQMREAAPASQIVALSAYREDGVVAQMQAAGAVGYAHKTGSPEEMLGLIRQAAHPRLEPRASVRSAALASPSSTELEVLRRFGKGFPLRQIAFDLQLAVTQVEQYRDEGMAKLGLTSRAEVARFAASKGWE